MTKITLNAPERLALVKMIMRADAWQKIVTHDLARCLDVDDNTALRYLGTLVSKGYAEKIGNRGPSCHWIVLLRSDGREYTPPEPRIQQTIKAVQKFTPAVVEQPMNSHDRMYKGQRYDDDLASEDFMDNAMPLKPVSTPGKGQSVLEDV